MNISFNMNINICVTTYFESKDSSQMGPGVDEPACLRYKIKNTAKLYGDALVYPQS